jgi:hypothetical protein
MLTRYRAKEDDRVDTSLVWEEGTQADRTEAHTKKLPAGKDSPLLDIGEAETGKEPPQAANGNCSKIPVGATMGGGGNEAAIVIYVEHAHANAPENDGSQNCCWLQPIVSC